MIVALGASSLLHADPYPRCQGRCPVRNPSQGQYYQYQGQYNQGPMYRDQSRENQQMQNRMNSRYEQESQTLNWTNPNKTQYPDQANMNRDRMIDQIKSFLQNSERYNEVNASAKNGKIVLEGTVQSQQDKNMLDKAIRNMNIENVDNQVKIQNQS